MCQLFRNQPHMCPGAAQGDGNLIPPFIPHPKMAMEAPAGKLAYVAILAPTRKGRPDAMGAIGVDPASKF